MYIAVSELLVKPDQKAIAGQYHDSLEPHLHRIAGFVQEKRYTSVDVPNKVLILSWWEDAAAISRWRNQSNHLHIQEVASTDVFQDYSIRIGPAYDADQSIMESVPQPRCFMVLHWSQKKQTGQATGIEKTSEVRDEAALSRLKAVMLENTTYEVESSVLRLSFGGSREDALLYEESIVRVEGDDFERVCVERDYTRQRRDDAPHQQPGKLA